jgi:hypothetical protein
VKKLPIIAIISVLLAVGWLTFGGWRASLLQGKLKTVAVTKRYFSPTATNADGLNIFEKRVVIQQPAELAAIEKSLTSVRNYYGGGNSMEGLPRYRMQVEYTNGKTQTFVFTKTEWGGSGSTPRPLLEELEKHGL